MVRYVTKDEIGEEVYKILKDGKTWERSFLPRLAFDNESGEVMCPECDTEKEVRFQFNIANAAGFDEVIFEWDVDLERLYLTGHVCAGCGDSEVRLHEKSPENEGEVVFEKDGLSR